MNHRRNSAFSNEPASPAPQATLTQADTTQDKASRSPASTASDASGNSPATSSAPPASRKLTVPEACQLFSTHGRKVPAARTFQNYCLNNQIEAEKIKTSTGMEWIASETSVLEFIRREPKLPDANEAPQASLAQADTTQHKSSQSSASTASDAAFALAVGESRTVADVLVENAKLLGKIETFDKIIDGKDETIGEMKDDRTFLRDELKDRRQLSRDMKALSDKMLDTIQKGIGHRDDTSDANNNQAARIEVVRPISDAQNDTNSDFTASGVQNHETA